MTKSSTSQPAASLAARPFRFGLSVRSAASRAEWVEKARKAEALGYSVFLIADHLAEMLPPLVPLVTVAETTDLRVGTFVLNNDFRHPALVARDAATIDLLTDGRFELGLGAGHMQAEYEQIGLAFDRAATRVERLAESVRIIKALLRGESVALHGSHYQLRDHRIYPLPVQRPHPPLLVGGNGRQILGLAAREAQTIGLMGFGHRRGGREINPSGFTEAATRTRIDWLREAAPERFADLELNVLVQRVIVTNHPQREADALANHLPGDLSAEDVLGSPFILIGSVEQIADELRDRRQRLGISYPVVFEKDMESFAGVIARLAAT